MTNQDHEYDDSLNEEQESLTWNPDEDPVEPWEEDEEGGDGDFDDADYDRQSDLDESMDGDFDSGMASAGFGTDEDYGYYGDNEDAFELGDD